MRLFLVGMMGSGKTTVGKLVAERLGVPFRDLDDDIVARAGKSIARIFAEDGEEKFRDLEHEALASLAEIESRSGMPGEVVALGGGVVLREGNRLLLRPHREFITWLDAKADTLAARLANSNRPLLAGLSGDALIARIAQITDARRELYGHVAMSHIANDGDDPVSMADAVVHFARMKCAPRIDLRPGGRFCGMEVAKGAIRRTGTLTGYICHEQRAALVVDAGVPSDSVEQAHGSLVGSGREVSIVRLSGGESSKAISRWEELLAAFAAAALDRQSLVVAIGGGATTDVAGFAAASYMRGISWVAVPTTLIGMVDAAIGGKTGVNLASGKNLAGAFHQPEFVVIDPDVLATLPAREVASGWGEIVKYALIDPEGPWQAVKQAFASGDLDIPDVATIEGCARFKAKIVQDDPLERKGLRKVLNFGHTIGHAIEAACGFGTIPHGVAVVLGMRGAVWLSREKGLLDRAEADEILDLLARFPAPPLPPEATGDALMQPLLRDKKFKDGKLLFVLLRKRGEPVVDVEVTRDEALAAIRFVRGDATR